MSQPANENKMGVMPENKLLLNMALPMIISMLIQACYNVVDSYFVAKLSQDALNAVSWASTPCSPAAWARRTLSGPTAPL